MAPFPSLVATWHTNTYPAISPSRPELSAAGKTIVITGGGTGIGASIARSFVQAGSTKIAIIGRRPEPLKTTAEELGRDFPGIQVLTCSADVTNKSQINTAFKDIAERFGPIDVLVNNAGYVTDAASLIDMDADDAWTAFEVNTKGTLLVAQAFGHTARASDALVIETSSIVAIIPPFPACSAYEASKQAAGMLWSYFGAENPGVRVLSIQPGQIQTDMATKLGLTGLDDGHFVVWLASPEARFLNGKFLCANWDVTELMARKEDFEKTALGSPRYQGFPSM